MSELTDQQIQEMKDEAGQEVTTTLDRLERDFPGVTEGLATALGSGAGAAGSLAALYALGVTGFSAAGITSGLATAGAIVGGGMVAGIGVLAAPVAALGVAGYAIARKRRNARLTAALGQAIAKLYSIQERLMRNAEHFREEIAAIKLCVERLAKKRPS
jgi:hypothetical protein